MASIPMFEMPPEPQSISEILAEAVVNENRAARLQAQRLPRCRYIIAFTPRAGSSYLADVMRLSGKLGAPSEAVSADAFPATLKKIPARTPEQYLENFFKVTRSGPVAGLKASWFQFRNFEQELSDKSAIRSCRYIFLTRRNLTAQAVSLYKATSSNVFHTNVDNPMDSFAKLANLNFDYRGIDQWRNHIAAQEMGWKEYFQENKIFPLSITFEEIDEDITKVINRIADFLGVKLDSPIPFENSSFRKISDSRNLEWALRFDQEMVTRGSRPLASDIPRKGISLRKIRRKFSQRCMEYFKRFRFLERFSADTFKLPSELESLPHPPEFGLPAVARVITEKISQRQPFSMIRLGDGEGAVIGYPKFVSFEKFNKFQRMFFGQHNLSTTQKKLLVQELKSAIGFADIIGVHGGNVATPFNVARAYLRYFKLVHPATKFCQANIHRKLQEENYFEKILKDLPLIGIISCRQIAEPIRKRFNIGRVAFYSVPEEACHAFSPNLLARHFPERFEQLRHELKVEYPGMVFLVGAGPCGKVYCRWIKERGGIALDIGSVFDGWSGKRTREYLGNLEVDTRYRLVPNSKSVS